MADAFMVYPIAVNDTLTAIREGLVHRYTAWYLPGCRRTKRRTRRLRRIKAWIREIDHLQSQIENVNRRIIPAIETDLGYTFKDTNPLIRILVDTTTKRLFLGILNTLPEADLPVPARDIFMLAKMPGDASALALIGDVTLRLRVVPGAIKGAFTSPGESDTRLDASALFESHLALCDHWKLFENAIGLGYRPRPTGEERARERATLVQAVFGALYLEGGRDALEAAVPLLRDRAWDTSGGRPERSVTATAMRTGHERLV